MGVRLLPLVMLLTSSLTVFSQTYFSEDFANCNNNFIFYNPGQQNGLSYTWFCTGNSLQTPHPYILSSYSWAISPRVDLTSSVHPWFRFRIDNANDKVYTHIMITTETVDPQFQNNGYSYTSLNWQEQSINLASNSNKEYAVDLSAFKGQKIHIAFVYIVDVQPQVLGVDSIDDVLVEENSTEISFLSHGGKVSALPGFGHVGSGISHSYEVRVKNNLLNKDLVISATNYRFSETLQNPSYASVLTLPANKLNQDVTIYVQYQPDLNNFEILSALKHEAGPVTKILKAIGHLTPDVTFDVATWHLDSFGLKNAGPADEFLQEESILDGIVSLDADLVALQNVGTENARWDDLVNKLSVYGYKGYRLPLNFVGGLSAFVYKTSTVQVNNYGWVDNSYAIPPNPFYIDIDATINGVKKSLRVINMQADYLGADPLADYNSRKMISDDLKNFLDDPANQLGTIILGNYGDDIDISTWGGLDSPYKNFANDANNYAFVTKPLTANNLSTTLTGITPIDHIMITNELFSSLVYSSMKLEHSYEYIGDQANTTTSGIPVKSSFTFVDPKVSIDISKLDFGNQPKGTQSSGLVFQITRQDVFVPLTIKAPKDYMISLYNDIYKSEITLKPSPYETSTTKVYLQFWPNEAGVNPQTISGDVLGVLNYSIAGDNNLGTLLSVTGVQTNPYCTDFSGVDGSNYYIEKFETQKSSNSSGQGPYSDFTASSPFVDMFCGSAFNYDLSVIVHTKAGDPAFVIAAIDFDRNGSFTTDEIVVPSTMVTPNQLFALPAFRVCNPNMVEGKTRFRIVSRKQEFPPNFDFCSDKGTGETEDYTVNIGSIVPGPPIDKNSAGKEDQPVLSVYPNPAKESVIWTIPTGNDRQGYELIITDFMGMAIYKESGAGSAGTVDLSRARVETGIYILRIHMDDGTSFSGRISVK